MSEKPTQPLTIEQLIAVLGLVLGAVALGFALGYAFAS